MKAFGFIALLLILGIAGYLMIGSGHDANGIPTGELAQAQAAKGMEDRARAAMASVDLVALKTQVITFQSQKGRFPTSLDELKAAGFIDVVPAGVTYDAATGELKATQP